MLITVMSQIELSVCNSNNLLVLLTSNIVKWAGSYPDFGSGFWFFSHTCCWPCCGRANNSLDCIPGFRLWLGAQRTRPGRRKPKLFIRSTRTLSSTILVNTDFHKKKCHWCIICIYLVLQGFFSRVSFSCGPKCFQHMNYIKKSITITT